MPESSTADEQFYSRYDWCLNPILSVRQLIHRFGEELDAYPLFSGWQHGWQRVEPANTPTQLANRFRQSLGVPGTEAGRPVVELS